jgi:N-carbamoyl-L-amino-acid hydrolase
MTFDRLWDDLAPVGREGSTGGYRRYAWTPADATLREWFAGEASARGLDLVVDRPATSGRGGVTRTRQD